MPIHDFMADCHPVYRHGCMDDLTTSIASFRMRRGSLVCLSYLFTCYPCVFVQLSTGRRPVDWCRTVNLMSVLCIHTYIHIYIPTSTHIYMHKYIQTTTNTYIHIYIHILVYIIYTYIHTYIHAYIYKYIHTYMNT